MLIALLQKVMMSVYENKNFKKRKKKLEAPWKFAVCFFKDELSSTTYHWNFVDLFKVKKTTSQITEFLKKTFHFSEYDFNFPRDWCKRTRIRTNAHTHSLVCTPLPPLSQIRSFYHISEVAHFCAIRYAVFIAPSLVQYSRYAIITGPCQMDVLQFIQFLQTNKKLALYILFRFCTGSVMWPGTEIETIPKYRALVFFFQYMLIGFSSKDGISFSSEDATSSTHYRRGRNCFCGWLGEHWSLFPVFKLLCRASRHLLSFHEIRWRVPLFSSFSSCPTSILTSHC